MTSKGTAIALVGIVIVVAVFGLYLMLLMPSHSGGCPLMVAEATLCRSSLFEHISLWQTMFASILISLALCIGLVLLERGEVLRLAYEHQHVRYRVRHVPERPTLFQELFSRGIHNRKEP